MKAPPKLTAAQVAALCPEYDNFVEIGEGGFKTVYRATRTGLPEVIKVVGIPSTDGTEDQERYRDECLHRVQREVNILQRCQTPTMVKLGSMPLIEMDVAGSYYVIYSEELLPGVDLRAAIHAKSGVPAESEAKLLLRSLLEAIRELWSHRYIHRDIKPANVIRTGDPSRPFVLIDLGIAFGLLETALTVQGTPCTLRYLAPEMANPNFRDAIDYRSDLYTAALTVFEYAAGQHPIARGSDDQIRTVSRALHQAPRRLKELRPEFSDGFCRLIHQLLKKAPALRPANFDLLFKQTAI